jgi:hypothetical protein
VTIAFSWGHKEASLSERERDANDTSEQSSESRHENLESHSARDRVEAMKRRKVTDASSLKRDLCVTYDANYPAFVR